MVNVRVKSEYACINYKIKILEMYDLMNNVFDIDIQFKSQSNTVGTPSSVLFYYIYVKY